MSFRASLSVILGCQFQAAQKLLAAAEAGQENDVKEVLLSKPQLAAFAGWHGTTTPLHRAAAGGHLSTVQAILELIKARAEVAEGDGSSGRARRWRSLLRTVIDQRTHRGQTALMLACEGGHTPVVSYLLAAGADALGVDMIHARTALHYAAIGGHAGCVRVLCSDAATVDIGGGATRPLRDAVTADMQVQSAKYIDQRSMGGLTALHFAAVSGSLDTLQTLLRAGAAIMVKTDGEAFIGQEYLTPGSTPLHISVLVGSMPLAHAMLQAHAGMMAVSGGGGSRDERRRRAWEGHSRSDVRSVRNAARKLPYHLARDRGWAQMMHLVDPRVPVDAALDAARDTDAGIGPKNLGTICSLVLQQSLLDWLDQRASELEEEREAEARADAAQAAARAGLTLRSFADGPVAGPSGGGAAPPPPGSSTAPAVAMLSAERMDSLHTYLGMLSVRRPVPAEGRHAHARAATLGVDGLTWSPPGKPKRRVPGMPRARSTGALLNALDGAGGDSILSVTLAPSAGGSAAAAAASADLGAAGAMRRVFSTLRDRLKTPEAVAAAEPPPIESPPADPADAKLAAAAIDSGDECKSLGGASCSGDSGSGSADVECGVCLDRAVEVAFRGCEHALCLGCARSLTQQERKPPICPFCRRMVVGFVKVP